MSECTMHLKSNHTYSTQSPQWLPNNTHSPSTTLVNDDRSSAHDKDNGFIDKLLSTQVNVVTMLIVILSVIILCCICFLCYRKWHYKKAHCISAQTSVQSISKGDTPTSAQHVQIPSASQLFHNDNDPSYLSRTGPSHKSSHNSDLKIVLTKIITQGGNDIV